MLPTVDHVHVARKLFLCWRVDARTQPFITPRVGRRLRVLVASRVRRAWSMCFLPLRARKVVTTGSVRDGP